MYPVYVHVYCMHVCVCVCVSAPPNLGADAGPVPHAWGGEGHAVAAHSGADDGEGGSQAVDGRVQAPRGPHGGRAQQRGVHPAGGGAQGGGWYVSQAI